MPVFADLTIDEASDAEVEEIYSTLEAILAEDDYRSCEYSPEEQAVLEMMHWLFEQHTEWRIVQRLFTNDDMRTLVRAYTDEFVMSLEYAIQHCDTWSWMWYFPYDYEELESELVSYVNTVLQLKGQEAKIWLSDPAAYWFDQLRTILMWENIALIKDDARLEQVFNMILGIQSTSEEDTFGLNLDLGIDSTGAADGSSMQWSFTLWWDLKIESEYENINTWWDMSAEIRLVDDHMYLKLDTFDIDLGDIEFENQYEAQSFNQMMETVKLFKWKFIDIPLEIQWDMMMWNPFMMAGWWLEMQQEMMLDIMQQDRLTTYHTQDSITYAWLNPLACAAMDDMWWVWGCLQARQDMMDHTDGKGMFFMTQQWWETNMWITDKFSGDWMPDEMRKIANQPILSWSADEITRIDVPLYDEDVLMGRFLYENKKISFDGRFPTQEYDRETWDVSTSYIDVNVNGGVSNDQVQMVWQISWSDMEANFSLSWWWTLESMNIDMTLTVVDTSEYPVDFSMIMKLDSSQIVTNPVDISAPDPSEIIDIDSLMAY